MCRAHEREWAGRLARGTGGGPVVTFASGETPASVLDSLTITGGRADAGGGVLILGSSPTVVRTVITQNRAGLRGSGIYVEAGAPYQYSPERQTRNK